MRVPANPSGLSGVGRAAPCSDWDGSTMKPLFLTLAAPLAAASLVLPACAEVPAAEAQAEAPATDSARAKLAYDATKKIAEAPPGYQPPFTQETVSKLNPIMECAKRALDRFDVVDKDIGAAQQSGDQNRVAALKREMAEIKSAAERAEADFRIEKAALLSRDEYYDKPMLAAMEYFVSEAPAEISDALAKLGK